MNTAQDLSLTDLDDDLGLSGYYYDSYTGIVHANTRDGGSWLILESGARRSLDA